MSSKKAASKAVKKVRPPKPFKVSFKTKIHLKKLINPDYIRDIDNKLLNWPNHINHLFFDATPMVFRLPLTRRVRSTHKQRAKADELLMYMAYKFHHSQSSLKTSSVVFDRISEMDNEDDPLGIDFRVLTAYPHFHDANHLLLRQAQLNPALTKASAFVTDNSNLTLQLNKLGAGLVLSPEQWLDYVMAANGKSGKYDSMIFMREFATKHRKDLEIPNNFPPGFDATKIKDPYAIYQHGAEGYVMDLLPPGMASADWHGIGKTRYQYRTGDAPQPPIEIFRRQAEVEKKKAVVAFKRDEILAALNKSSPKEAESKSTTPSNYTVDGEFKKYINFLNTCTSPELRKTLQADKILEFIKENKINPDSMDVTDATVIDTLQNSLNEFFMIRVAEYSPSLWEAVEDDKVGITKNLTPTNIGAVKPL